MTLAFSYFWTANNSKDLREVHMISYAGRVKVTITSDLLADGTGCSRSTVAIALSRTMVDALSDADRRWITKKIFLRQTFHTS